MLGINRIIIAWSLRIMAATGIANSYGRVVDKSSSHLQDQTGGGSILLQSFSHVQVLEAVGDTGGTEPIHKNTSTRIMNGIPAANGDLASATEARGWAFAQEVISTVSSKEHAEPPQKKFHKATNASTMGDAFQALLNNQTSLVPRKPRKEHAEPLQKEAQKTKNASSMGDAFQALLNNQTSLIPRKAGKTHAEPLQKGLQKKNASAMGDAFQAPKNRASLVTRNASSAQPPPGQISLHSEEMQKAATPPSNKTSSVNLGAKTSAPPKSLPTHNMVISSMKTFVSESCAEFREGSRQWASLALFLFTGMTQGFGHLAEISAEYPFGMSAIGMLLLLGFALLKEIRELKASNAELISRCMGRPMQLDSRWLSRFYNSSLSRSAVPWQSDQLTEAVGGRE